MNITASRALTGMSVVDLGIPKEFIICYEEVNGNMFPRVLWSSLEALYDACWVHMCREIHLNRDFSCIVIAITDEEHTDAKMLELIQLGYITSILRTECKEVI